MCEYWKTFFFSFCFYWFSCARRIWGYLQRCCCLALIGNLNIFYCMYDQSDYLLHRGLCRSSYRHAIGQLLNHPPTLGHQWEQPLGEEEAFKSVSGLFDCDEDAHWNISPLHIINLFDVMWVTRYVYWIVTPEMADRTRIVPVWTFLAGLQINERLLSCYTGDVRHQVAFSCVLLTPYPSVMFGGNSTSFDTQDSSKAKCVFKINAHVCDKAWLWFCTVRTERWEITSHQVSYSTCGL